VPQSLGGSDEPDNLALACHRCNPRLQQWSEHFIWTADGTKILGITPIGRATCNRLDINDEGCDEHFIQKYRRFWVQGGWHPPTSDPRQK
jgi:hypothetical protein